MNFSFDRKSTELKEEKNVSQNINTIINIKPDIKISRDNKKRGKKNNSYFDIPQASGIL